MTIFNPERRELLVCSIIAAYPADDLPAPSDMQEIVKEFTGEKLGLDEAVSLAEEIHRRYSPEEAQRLYEQRIHDRMAGRPDWDERPTKSPEPAKPEPERLDLLPLKKFPGYSVDPWGIPYAAKKRGRAGGKLKLQKFFYKGKEGRTRFVSRYRLTVDGKQTNVSAKYLQTARLFAEMNARNETVETIEDFIMSDGE